MMGHLALSFFAPASHPSTGPQLRARGAPIPQARGGDERDVSDADIEAVYKETISGKGADPPKGTITVELIVEVFYREFSSKGFCALIRILERPTSRNNWQEGEKDRAILSVQLKNKDGNFLRGKTSRITTPTRPLFTKHGRCSRADGRWASMAWVAKLDATAVFLPDKKTAHHLGTWIQQHETRVFH
mmetsp:Transcript_137958/g.275027  ORF Transcript_137958/g.275027 Transcript_137958/m.275027 type:complete len:188 (+) Transcript_137958:54-617(+)